MHKGVTAAAWLAALGFAVIAAGVTHDERADAATLQHERAALNAPTVFLISQNSRCKAVYGGDADKVKDCKRRMAAGTVLLRWAWSRSPCAAPKCYAADGFTIIDAGNIRTLLDARKREAWVARPQRPSGCITISAVHNSPALSRSRKACLTKSAATSSV